MAEPARPEVRYAAFLSYSHKDAAAAGRLHRRLESYRMPKRLVGSDGARGPVPDRLSPIFRDREELPAATDLSETVREALGQSGALIILCSPHAAESLWVAEEIETFRTLHPDRPILAAILDGDPPDCFPAALRAFGRDGTWHEPLATDLRPGKDGKQLGLLKLVAGITGVGLDALVQRDSARRIRRVMAVTGAAVVAMLIMAALAMVALNARREAERQRAEAEGLVKFMLTDLRQELRGVGRLAIMSAVNQRALSYYDRQPARGGSLAMRARVLHAIGEDYVARGNMRAALARFLEAHRATTALIEQFPNDPEIMFAHGQSEYWVGSVYFSRQDWPVALRYFVRYEAAAERLVELAPDNPDYMMEMGWGALNLGMVQLNGTADPIAARASFEKALRWFAQAERSRPRDERIAAEQANAYAWLADSFYARSLWRESLAARLQEHRIKERLLRSDPTNVERAYRLASAERAIARLADRAGDRRTGRAFLLRAYAGSQQLTANDPQNASWMLLRIKVECDLLSQVPARDREVSDEQLRQRVIASATLLRSQDNPRMSEIRDCLDRVSP